MSDNSLTTQQEDLFDPIEVPGPQANEEETKADVLYVSSTEEATENTVFSGILGHVNIDGRAADNTTSEVMVSTDQRNHFRREIYVGIQDKDQDIEFLGRIVEGPFHIHQESGTDQVPELVTDPSSYDVFGNIEILGSLGDGERVIPAPTRPRPHSEIYIFPPERLRKLLAINGNMLLGRLTGYDEQKVEVRANTENKNFLPLNVGIFGTVGSGKSNTVQVLVEEASNANWACVVIDVEGEYVGMNEPGHRPEMNRILREQYAMEPEGMQDFRVYVPSSGTSDADDSIRFKVPISELDISIISDILDFSEPEFRMYEKAVEATQRTHLQGASSRSGTQVQAITYPYTLESLIGVLANTAFLTRLSDIEKSTANTLRNKLFYTLGRSGMLDWTPTENTPYLSVSELLVGGRVSIFDVSETDDRSRNIAIAHILQSVFNKVIETEVGETLPGTDVPRPKVLLVIEEVHTFVSKQSIDKMKAVLDSLQTISRRGRKRWLSLALVSQQPGHLPEELFELANTRFIHQIKSAVNLDPVKQTTGGIHDALWSTIPSLGPGQCLLTSRIFKDPLFVNIRPAKSKRLLTA
ncbi:MAG: ATP-binding protein [Bacteroidota bacterium]